jgi:chitin synthase
MNLTYQKYLIIFFLFILNTTLSTTFIIYNNKWYIYIFILALSTGFYTINSILLIFNKYFNKEYDYDIKRLLDPKKYLYLIPCYNESEEELMQTILSIVYQKTVNNDKRAMIIVCDGMVKGVNNIKSTDKILLNILNNKNEPKTYEYITRENNENVLYIYDGIFNDINYILLIKKHNSGKRDSLVLVRQFCYEYNNNENDNYITNKLKSIYDTNIDYIIGIDADTIFDYNCSYELIKALDKDENIHGCVGYIDINKNMNFLNPFVLYQYAEYTFAQCLKRQAQSNITHKVNCLSGCNQIIRVSNETCGEDILSKFNYCPTEKDNILVHIRSIASEDRNHICIMHSMYPYIKTVQSLSAIAYTTVPTNLHVFLSQRRRWSLGANSNDILLILLPNINLFEKILSTINVFIFTLSPFICIATIMFIKSLITNASMLMLYLSIIMIIPFTYGLCIPIFIKQMILKHGLYFYISYIYFIIFGSIINMVIYFYSIFSMDTIKWGKTRKIVNQENNTIDYYIDDNINDDINKTSFV